MWKSEEFAIVVLGIAAVLILIAGMGIQQTQDYKADPTWSGNGTPPQVKFWSNLGVKSKHDG